MEISPVKDSRATQVNNICAWVPNINGNEITWYCIALPFAILLLWLVYQTIFMLLISKVMQKNRNTEPTVSLNARNQFKYVFQLDPLTRDSKAYNNHNCGLGDDL